MANSVIKTDVITHEINKKVTGDFPEAVNTYFSNKWATVYFYVYENWTGDVWRSINLTKSLRTPNAVNVPINACVSENGEHAGLVQVIDNGTTSTLRIIFHDTFTGYARGSITYPI